MTNPVDVRAARDDLTAYVLDGAGPLDNRAEAVERVDFVADAIDDLFSRRDAGSLSWRLDGVYGLAVAGNAADERLRIRARAALRGCEELADDYARLDRPPGHPRRDLMGDDAAVYPTGPAPVATGPQVARRVLFDLQSADRADQVGAACAVRWLRNGQREYLAGVRRPLADIAAAAEPGGPVRLGAVRSLTDVAHGALTPTPHEPDTSDTVPTFLDLLDDPEPRVVGHAVVGLRAAVRLEEFAEQAPETCRRLVDGVLAAGETDHPGVQRAVLGWLGQVRWERVAEAPGTTLPADAGERARTLVERYRESPVPAVADRAGTVDPDCIP